MKTFEWSVTLRSGLVEGGGGGGWEWLDGWIRCSGLKTLGG